MPGKVFISCGQKSEEEKDIANNIASWFRDQGFDPYIAIEVQSILDLNGGVIGELKTSDYYLFINFRREKILSDDGNFYRGSVYTNQELAIAYTMGFDKIIFLNQVDARREGMFASIVSNTPEFASFDELLSNVKKAVNKAQWDPNYSRNLVMSNLHWSSSIIHFGDHTGQRDIKALYIRVENKREDAGAIDTVVRLAHIVKPNGKRIRSPDRSHLKSAGASNRFSQTIWPQSHVSYDILALDMNNQTQIFLCSELDVIPRQPIISQTGMHQLEYEVFSQGFPSLKFTVELNNTGNHNNTTATLL